MPSIDEQCADFRAERLEMLGDDKPDGFELDAEIVMDQYVAHAGDLLPRNVGIGRPKLVREAFDGFTDDFKIAYDCILRHYIVEKLVASAGRVVLDSLDRIANVQEINAIFLHSGTASESIRCSR